MRAPTASFGYFIIWNAIQHFAAANNHKAITIDSRLIKKGMTIIPCYTSPMEAKKRKGIQSPSPRSIPLDFFYMKERVNRTYLNGIKMVHGTVLIQQY